MERLKARSSAMLQLYSFLLEISSATTGSVGGKGRSVALSTDTSHRTDYEARSGSRAERLVRGRSRAAPLGWAARAPAARKAACTTASVRSVAMALVPM